MQPTCESVVLDRFTPEKIYYYIKLALAVAVTYIVVKM